jgi:tellurite methyltransferase
LALPAELAFERGLALAPLRPNLGAAMLRAIRGFRKDDEGAWVAELECGHPQHVRHSPPWQNYAWVQDPIGRQAKLGSPLDCLFCNMAALPAGLVRYKDTAAFTELTTPAALTKDHRTKAGVWAEIEVLEGKLEYSCPRGTFVLRPGILGIVEPEVAHAVRPIGQVRFVVHFLRSAD